MLSSPVAEVLSVALLLAILASAVIRPWGWPEAVVAVPAAVVVVVTGAISADHARAEAAQLLPVIGFLAAVLVLAQLCEDEGLFHACGVWMARAGEGRPQALLVLVFGIASVVTAVLSLDATVVLLTPVVFATAARLGARPRPFVYATTHLSNTASLLLPVSNLTNLLALAASGLSFTRFAALMTLPWLAAIAVEYAVFRRFFAADLAQQSPVPSATSSSTSTSSSRQETPEVPVVVLVVLGCTLAGFVVTSAVGLDPALAAAGGAAVLGVRALVRRRATPLGLVRSAGIPFLAFVLALGLVVRAVVDHGLAQGLGHLVPGGDSLPALLGVAALAAVLANLINNLPAVLVLLPLTVPSGAGAVLAVLIGVNVGPNLTYVGSLATLLWRRIVREHDTDVPLGEFTRLGLLTVPAALVAAVLALWVSLQVIGG